ncbi:MAG: diaminopimelate epimerase, partial [Pseudomonadota bacterium]|nr:diaminopimelate epimerase [Pseudomonadota bacterium]
MKLRFTKMEGAGNDFVMLDGTAAPLALSDAQLRRLADRRFGIGADQILVAERSVTPGVDFRYRIFNGGSGDEVEQCGNGARCFAQFVRARGLTDKRTLKVETRSSLLELRLQHDGRVTVDMGSPVFDPARVPFDPSGLVAHAFAAGQTAAADGFALWPLDVGDQTVDIAVLSVGNPHAVLIVESADSAPVESLGPSIGRDPRFANGVNVGFMQVVGRSRVRLRVYERGAGETLACGTGACA